MLGRGRGGWFPGGSSWRRKLGEVLTEGAGEAGEVGGDIGELGFVWERCADEETGGYKCEGKGLRISGRMRISRCLGQGLRSIWPSLAGLIWRVVAGKPGDGVSGRVWFSKHRDG